jgi:hypothetical protein
MSAVYPTIEDWDAYVDSLTPAPSAIGDSGVWIRGLSLPWSSIDQELLTLAAGYVDLEQAPAWVLEIAGAQVNEPPAGLGTTEYRRIVAGRRLSIGSAAEIGDVYAVLLGLAGSDVGRIGLISDGTHVALFMFASAGFEPMEPYLQRAGRVLRDAIDRSMPAEAILYTAATYLWGAVLSPTSAWGYPLAV